MTQGQAEIVAVVGVPGEAVLYDWFFGVYFRLNKYCAGVGT